MRVHVVLDRHHQLVAPRDDIGLFVRPGAVRLGDVEVHRRQGVVLQQRRIERQLGVFLRSPDALGRAWRGPRSCSRSPACRPRPGGRSGRCGRPVSSAPSGISRAHLRALETGTRRLHAPAARPDRPHAPAATRRRTAGTHPAPAPARASPARPRRPSAGCAIPRLRPAHGPAPHGSGAAPHGSSCRSRACPVPSPARPTPAARVGAVRKSDRDNGAGPRRRWPSGA